MHLLYLDDSGSVGNAADRHIILAGLAVFERLPHWFGLNLDKIAERLWPTDPSALEFRGADIHGGKRIWRRIKRDIREAAYREALGLIGNSSRVCLFAAAIHQKASSPDDPMERAFEQICNRFDRYLGRMHRVGNTQRGLIILDQSSYETSLQGLARDFREVGHRWGQLYNLADVPFFVNSKATRMIQFADLIAYAVRKYYENGDSSYFDIISHRFDRVGPSLHGLVHYTPSESACNCLACRSRGA